MKSQTKTIIAEMLEESNQIQKELDSIASELMSFKGIGADNCTRMLKKMADEYRQMRNQLKNV
ncbi:hypothetical protein [Acetobacterium wieringae]|uniref:hypothetical protein n=1 Tax=Acetobacterium wieringae TaxID=52694 RepID=UPI003158D181